MSQPIRVKPALWFHTPMGDARAHWMIVEEEQDILWICFMQDSGECRTFSNQNIRLMSNDTIGRRSKVLGRGANHRR